MMLRPAGAADLPAIGGLIDEHPMALLSYHPGWLAEVLADPASRLLVWDRKGFAGFAMLLAAWPQVLHLANLAVRHRGDGQALIAAVLCVAFDDMQAHRVFGDTASDNARARSAFRRAGFVEEGTFRQCWLRPDGQWADCTGLAILRSDWHARQTGPRAG